MKRVLPVGCFHVVFTLPAQLRPLARRHPREMYDLLFRAAADTLLALGRTPRHLGAELGITSVPHTCNRQLEHHPHVHCICTAGGLSPDGTRWVACRPNLLFPVKVMGKLMRRRFLDGLMRLRKSGRCTTTRTVRTWRSMATHRSHALHKCQAADESSRWLASVGSIIGTRGPHEPVRRVSRHHKGSRRPTTPASPSYWNWLRNSQTS